MHAVFPPCVRSAPTRPGRALRAGRVLGWALAGALVAGAPRVGLRAAEVMESDVCVYGGTSGGVIAAVQAARLGKSVALVEPGRHVGGMTSGGLGRTDTGNVGTIGGLSREFYRRVGRHYGASESFAFEPHVAEEVFLGMLREAKVGVYYGRRLASVTLQGRRITAMMTEQGDEFRAGMYLDTTYEGDLLAAAGITFTFGRESTNAYGEPLNGIRARTPSHQFALAVDPYVVPGEAGSGLLPFIQEGDGGVPGDGDARIQAYNFRLCLTQVVTNRLPIAPPAGYDPARYELLGRYLAARVAAGHQLTLASVLKVDAMPNGKTDINNNGAFSTDYIGMNYTYPTNTAAARAALWRDHEDYTRGLLTFLATDPRVPEAVRTSMAAWGLCRDEFQDTGGWPHQLYVREARRMVSDYVMTQADCAGTRVASDSVGLASYNMDSHNCQRFARSGAVTNEGDVQSPPAGPFPIAYRSIVPRWGECENLLATFCLSGSHIAFSSCRMEPVFMITSQSAASAAALAMDDGVAVQTVPYGKLRLQLLADGQVLEWGSASAPTNGIILDSEQPSAAVTVSGAWVSSTAIEGYHGTNYLHDGNTGKGDKWVRFTPDLPAAGRYTVFLRWPANANRATNVPIAIAHAEGITHLAVNQRVNGSIWFPLGTFPFEPGTNGHVLLETTGTASGYVIADATLWAPAEEPLLPTVEVIASDATAGEDGPDPAVFTVIRSGDTTSAVTVACALSGTATAGTDFPAAAGSLWIPAGHSFLRVTILPAPDAEAEENETVVLTLGTNTGYRLGAYTQAGAVIRDGGLGRWRASQFEADELADPGISGPQANPDADSLVNLLEFFHGTDPKASNASPALRLTEDALGWGLTWRRSMDAAGLFLRVEVSPDLDGWVPAPWAVQEPQITAVPPFEELRFPLGELRLGGAQAFYRLAVSQTPLALTVDGAHCFFSFDTDAGGTNGFQEAVTANVGFPGTPAVSRTGTLQADAGGAESFTDFTGVTWLGSGGSTTPGHSLVLNNGSVNNSLSLEFSTLGLQRVRLRMDVRSAAQPGGVAPAEFTGLTYTIGGGPQPVPGASLSVVADNAFHEWALDLSTLTAINNRPWVMLRWTIKNLNATPAESFRVDNIQATAWPSAF
ncbi:MAG: FAD-dependent oxidoreductase [Verrucomicrobia bacterium]|nr:FAD-dependent oxidoreductase [Verrucomicrobiota bacterium]